MRLMQHLVQKDLIYAANARSGRKGFNAANNFAQTNQRQTKRSVRYLTIWLDSMMDMCLARCLTEGSARAHARTSTRKPCAKRWPKSSRIVAGESKHKSRKCGLRSGAYHEGVFLWRLRTFFHCWSETYGTEHHRRVKKRIETCNTLLQFSAIVAVACPRRL